MAVSRSGLALLALLPWFPVSDARADQQPGSCRVIDVDFTPGGFPATAKDPEIVPQIVAWLEKPGGEYVATLYITDQTGRYGLGNRPGRFDFNSGPNWPYGRRVTVFPVWANRHGLKFQQVNYQNGEDFNLSHPAGDSSPEVHYCRPLMQGEPPWDAASCPSMVFTDKGVFTSGTASALYPPRADLTASPKASGGQDSPSVEDYRNKNPFDAVSQASPRLGMETQISWPIPPTLTNGDYLLYVEVALERDFNASYGQDRYPSPGATEIPWSEYGVAYRGQPSVIYKVPFTISDTEAIAMTDTYAGYGDPGPDAVNGKTPSYFSPRPDPNPPDDTITTDRPGSGAARLLLTSKGGQTFRVRVDARTEPDLVAPGPPGAMAVVDTQSGGATLSFTAPGDDGMVGTVTGYDVRYRVGTTPISDADFNSANEARFTGKLVRAGDLQTLQIANLLPETPYSFAVRAFDDCHNSGTITTVMFTTAPRKVGEVDACFIATAAYGSLLANDVEMLRRFRDRMLKHSVLGELAVETYYTFGPTVAGLIGESDLLRSTARDALAPLVRWVREVH
ncbi:MAG TPA: fibronectin type III domain-containing protein [Kofleriaceae bacterium]